MVCVCSLTLGGYPSSRRPSPAWPWAGHLIVAPRYRIVAPRLADGYDTRCSGKPRFLKYNNWMGGVSKSEPDRIPNRLKLLFCAKEQNGKRKQLYGPWMAAWKSYLSQLVQRCILIRNPCQGVNGSRSLLPKCSPRDLLSTVTIRRAFSVSPDGKCFFLTQVIKESWQNYSTTVELEVSTKVSQQESLIDWNCCFAETKWKKTKNTYTDHGWRLENAISIELSKDPNQSGTHVKK